MNNSADTRIAGLIDATMATHTFEELQAVYPGQACPIDMAVWAVTPEQWEAAMGEALDRLHTRPENEISEFPCE